MTEGSLIYHFMFGPTYAARLPVCSSSTDNLDPNAVNLAPRDVKLMLVSRAALDKLGEWEAWKHTHATNMTASPTPPS